MKPGKEGSPISEEGDHELGKAPPSPQPPPSTGVLAALFERVCPGVMSEGVALRWFVRTIDNAGNTGGGVGQSRTFTIDSTAPPAPTITGGPTGATNGNAPTFRWSGPQARFNWAVYPSGTEAAVQAGSGD